MSLKPVKISEEPEVRARRQRGKAGRKADHEKDPRAQAALEEARKAEERLLRRIEREQQQPCTGPTEGAMYAKEARERAAKAQEEKASREWLAEVGAGREARPPRYQPYDGDGSNGYNRAAARSLLRQGYSVPAVMKRTGVGWRHLEDLRIDDEGFLR